MRADNGAYLRTLSAVELARAIREGRTTSRAAVDAYIEAIERVNGALNAVVEDRFVVARLEADAADAARANGQPNGPLHGVPCTIKECFGLEGMPQTSGLVSRIGTRATEDAVAVKRLRGAGAIPLGVTNVSELCMWMETHNRVYGRTNNPYDPSRIVGGSSGGEGSIIGAGASPFGLGSDVGGSVRMPAFFNGVFGHKPSGGLVPNTGQFPIAQTPQSLRYLTTGPLARSAEDLHVLLRVLAGDSDRLGDPDQVDLAGLRVLDVRSDGVTPVSRDLQQAQARAAAHLHKRGADVVEVMIPGLRDGLEIWSAMLGAENPVAYGRMLAEGDGEVRASELLRWAFGRSPHTLPSLGLVVAESVLHRLTGRADEMIRRGEALRTELAERIGDGVMLYPSYASVAPRHLQPLLPPTRWVYTALLNVMEMPATQVPLGLDPRGLPLGVQVCGRHGNDHVTLAVAAELERAFGGWVRPRPGKLGP